MKSPEELYGDPRWVDGERARSFEEGQDFDPYQFYQCAAMLDALNKRVDLSIVDRVIDFGSGYGEGLLALDMLVKAVTDRQTPIIGSEVDASCIPFAKAVAKRLDAVSLKTTNGIELVRKNRSQRTLVTAMMLGPTWEFPFIEKLLIDAAVGEGDRTGITLISSDERSMQRAKCYADMITSRNGLAIIHFTRDELGYGLRGNGIEQLAIIPIECKKGN